MTRTTWARASAVLADLSHREQHAMRMPAGLRA